MAIFNSKLLIDQRVAIWGSPFSDTPFFFGGVPINGAISSTILSTYLFERSWDVMGVGLKSRFSWDCFVICFSSWGLSHNRQPLLLQWFIITFPIDNYQNLRTFVLTWHAFVVAKLGAKPPKHWGLSSAWPIPIWAELRHPCWLMINLLVLSREWMIIDSDYW